MGKHLTYRAEYLAMRLVAHISKALGQHLRIKAGRMLGGVAFYLVPSLKATVIDNLKRAYPEYSEKQISTLARENFRHVGRMAMEFLALGSLSEKELSSLVRIEGVEVFKEAHARGKGVLLLGAHLGNWEIPAMVLGTLGYPVHGVGRRIHNHFVNDYVNSIRKSRGSTVIPHREAARPVLKALKNQEVVGMLLDQRARKNEWVPSTFFGQPVATNQGLAILALRSGAPVVYLSCLTEGEGYVMRFEKIIDPPPETMDRDERVREFTWSFDRTLEATIRTRPAEWFWMHRRWRLPKGFKS